MPSAVLMSMMLLAVCAGENHAGCKLGKDGQCAHVDDEISFLQAKWNKIQHEEVGEDNDALQQEDDIEKEEGDDDAVQKKKRREHEEDSDDDLVLAEDSDHDLEDEARTGSKTKHSDKDKDSSASQDIKKNAHAGHHQWWDLGGAAGNGFPR
eukprot:gnl/TRDRNA2_/TRDRNA2_174475_c1_seq3.p1 gnl/TRDRNA2_/TRDRNA2_174475_c1~~gnl/TRDRNA2_/TRDRNA2_174475_c1_seq3.p1  ORF type:complete len:152 (-),score=50.50 gnl/TRDRNA2_/TRDRNA2_174475_c1_seq3:85-540(-)